MTAPTPTSRPKLLIVDDTPENLDILIEALGGRYAVVAARDGERALRLAHGHPPPELILLDIMMPDLDGYEVCRRLKADPATCDIPVIFLTALTDEGSELRGLTAGAVDYVHKPISIPLVQARVATHLELAAARRQLAAQVQTLEEAALLRDDVERITRHDLKGPLTPILAYTELLSREPTLTPAQQAMVRDMRSAGRRLLELINSSLDLYRMETGRYEPRPVVLELGELLRRALGGLDALVRRRCLVVESDLPPVHAAAEEMLGFSLFTNLIKNAIEASAPGERIHIGLGAEAGWAVVRIANPAPVPEAIRATFFEKYTTAGKSGGTGLGTYSARLMARTLGGEVEMESDETRGTCITVRLPRDAPAGPAVTPSTGPAR